MFHCVAGFVAVSAAGDMPQVDLLKTCVMSGSWSSNGYGGNVAMRVVEPAIYLRETPMTEERKYAILFATVAPQVLLPPEHFRSLPA